jgi:hypothetical protein
MRTAVSRITVTLVCGDQITAKNPPLHNKTTYICEARRGHGYNVRWASYENQNTGFIKHNPDPDIKADSAKD